MAVAFKICEQEKKFRAKKNAKKSEMTIKTCCVNVAQETQLDILSSYRIAVVFLGRLRSLIKFSMSLMSLSHPNY